MNTVFMDAHVMVKAFKDRYPELAERVEFGLIHDSIHISCSPEDELEVQEKVAELSKEYMETYAKGMELYNNSFKDQQKRLKEK